MDVLHRMASRLRGDERRMSVYSRCGTLGWGRSRKITAVAVMWLGVSDVRSSICLIFVIASIGVGRIICIRIVISGVT